MIEDGFLIVREVEDYDKEIKGEILSHQNVFIQLLKMEDGQLVEKVLIIALKQI